MSQTDMTVANGTGAAVRDDIEDHLQALASLSIGNNAPATPYQGQFWLDNNTPSGTLWTLNIYDGSGWIAHTIIDTAANKAWSAWSLPLAGSGGVGGGYSMSGDILMGQNTTATPGSGNTTHGGNLSSNGSLHLSNSGAYVANFNRNGNGTIHVFCNSGSVSGSITVSGAATAFNTSSDYRLKINVEEITFEEALAVILQLRPVWFNWIYAPDAPRVDGFIAHEVQAILPHLVTGTKDEVETVHPMRVEGVGRQRRVVAGEPFERIKPQGIDQSKLTPLLTAFCKGVGQAFLALRQRVELLDAQLAALAPPAPPREPPPAEGGAQP